MPARTTYAERADLAAAAAGGAFSAPADLTERGAQLWREAMGMHPGSFWKASYLPFLRQWVDSVMACERLDKEITAEGETLEGPKGGAYLNPKVLIRDRERAQMKSLARMLAITPDSATHGSEGDKAARARAGDHAARVADAMAESQGLIPGLETVQ